MFQMTRTYPQMRVHLADQMTHSIKTHDAHYRHYGQRPVNCEVVRVVGNLITGVRDVSLLITVVIYSTSDTTQVKIFSNWSTYICLFLLAPTYCRYQLKFYSNYMSVNYFKFQISTDYTK
jgi:hypothetical protein